MHIKDIKYMKFPKIIDEQGNLTFNKKRIIYHTKLKSLYDI